MLGRRAEQVSAAIELDPDKKTVYRREQIREALFTDGGMADIDRAVERILPDFVNLPE